jgi:hypothetical protein
VRKSRESRSILTYRKGVGNIVYMMTLVPKPGDPILLLENLKNLLTKSKLMEFARTKRNQRRDDQVDPEDNKLSPQLYTHRVHEAGASSQVCCVG